MPAYAEITSELFRENASQASLTFLDLAGWDDVPVPHRLWVVRDVIPIFNVTLLSGDGAIGKSTLLLQLCCAVALERQDWLGFVLDAGGVVIYLGAEDDADELHRRFAHIANLHGVRFADLARNLHAASLAGRDAILGTVNRNGVVQPTNLYRELLELVSRIKPKLIALDTAADVFAGNENDRAQVRQFVGLLRALAIAGESAVLLASHPSLTGMHNDSGLSGSTAWHNSVRARLYLKSAANGAGEAGSRILETRKSNYGPLAQHRTLQWRDGVFQLVASPTDFERAAIDRRADETFLTLLNRFTAEGRNVSHKAGKGFAPSEFASQPEAATLKIGKPELTAAMQRLFEAKRIRVETYGRPSNLHERLSVIGLPL